MAGSGPFGFDAPRLIVQAKSQDAKVDVKVLRELTGVMGKFHADQTLLWAGAALTRQGSHEAAAFSMAAAAYFGDELGAFCPPEIGLWVGVAPGNAVVQK